ncbi:MAG: TadE/TadG family type IV pilus assembly protein [Desulfovibrio sp.]
MRSRTAHSGGMTVVEFAMIFPLLVLLVLGLLESGNLFSDWLTVRKAAQAGARFATTGQGEEEGTRLALIRSEVERVMSRLPGTTGVEVASWPTPTASGAGVENDAGCPCGMVEVRVEYEYQPVTPLLELVLNDTVLLSGSDRKVNEPWQRCE